MLAKVRYCESVPLPLRRFLPGSGMDHPSKNWSAHFGEAVALLHAKTIDRGGEAMAFRYGVDCYNASYFWEAHELWEPLWQAARGNDSDLAAVLKALIQFAAANVQLACGRTKSWRRLAERAERTALAAGVHQSGLLGIDWPMFLEGWRQALAADVPCGVAITL